MVSCVFTCFILSHGKEGDCYDEIPFPGKCTKHGKKECFEEMVSSNVTRRFLRCNCINWEPDKSVEEGHNVKHSHHDEHTEHSHICQCLRAVAGDCVPDRKA
ncbi:hypothetical protein N665_0783s0011 [Sinapis alba]|nr:hypothetical protein N665_0783s0011 [Sinapis alba]